MVKKYTCEELKNIGIHDLRIILREEFGGIPGIVNKEGLIKQILYLQDTGARPVRIVKAGRPPLRPPHPVKDAEFATGITFADPKSEEEREERNECKPDGNVYSETGVFELNQNENYGFLRVVNYDNSPRDVFVSPMLIRKYGIRNGDLVQCECSKNDMKAAAATEIKYINGATAFPGAQRVDFDDLVPNYPTERYTLENKNREMDLSIRCIDLFAPIGKGQRGLIVAPPKTGKTTLLKKIANSICENYPQSHLITLLIDERPEEVTDIKNSVNCEVVSSTFDETAEHHIKIAELVLARAKRLVENGRDVVVLLDSITRLARAYNAVSPSTGKTLSGGIETGALQSPKKFFGAARNIIDGGSLTIVATVLVDTGSKMDEVIYEEFKGTGNMELSLSRGLSEKRIFPAIDLYRSGTRKDELLLTFSERVCADSIRRLLADDKNASSNMLDMMARTADNKDFVAKVPEWIKLAAGG